MTPLIKQDFKPIIDKYNLKVITDINSIQTQKNITHKNKTCSDVNTIIQKQLHPYTKYYTGLKLLCKESYLYKSVRLYVNYTYEIKEIVGDIFVLNDGAR